MIEIEFSTVYRDRLRPNIPQPRQHRGERGWHPPPTRRQREPHIWGGSGHHPPPSVWRRRERSGRGVRATPHPPAAAAGAAGERLGAPPLLFGSNFPGYTFLWLISICRFFSQKSEERAEKYVLPSIKTSKITTKKSPAAPGKNALFYSIKTSKITKKNRLRRLEKKHFSIV